jgi:hypothetical protein
VDFAGHVGGARFVVLAQSDNWRERARTVVEGFRPLLESNAAPEVFARGYFAVDSRGEPRVRPLPRLVAASFRRSPASSNRATKSSPRRKQAHQRVPRGAASVFTSRKWGQVSF